MQGVTLAYGDKRLFDSIGLSVERGEKIALVGRNGSGKSTLLRLIEGSVAADVGTVALQKGVRVGYLSQTVHPEIQGAVFDVVLGGLREEETEKQHQVDKTLTGLGLDGGRLVESLSTGLKRQTLLGQALVGDPDVLLLDEPTNHMDIDSIRRLEETVARFAGAVILVTHDRTFLQRIATRIVEIDRGRLFDQTCDYETFLMRRDAAREVEDTQTALFDKRLKSEEVWRRKGVKARGTRNEGRVRELDKMREMRASRRDRPGTVKMDGQESERSGTLIMKAEDVSFSYGGELILSHFSTTIAKGERIGILGSNGSGKTTLLRILLGELRPDSGNVRLGSNLHISYFDQMLEQLDENKTVMDNVSEGNDTVTINGKTRHIMGYLQDFLFSPAQARTSVSVLSGGERNRLMLARLFTSPSNLMVLDEPTNDLDIETLDLLEDLLLNYSGTVLLISHDRAFINNVVTSTMVFEGRGVVKEYVGGYADWQRQRAQAPRLAQTAIKKESAPTSALSTKPRMKFRDRREMESLPHAIELLEEEQEALYQMMGDPLFYKKDKAEIRGANDRRESVAKLLTEAYVRWEELEQISKEATA